MKSLILLSAFIAGTAMASGYEPYKFRCTYDASNDGLITATSKINPDNDDWTFLLKSNLDNETETLEAKEAFVYSKNEKIDSEVERIINSLVKKLSIDVSQWFSTTDIILFSDKTVEMRFFKFNSENGSLGIGIYTKVQDQETLTECK